MAEGRKKNRSFVFIAIILCAAVYVGYTLVSQQIIIIEKNAEISELDDKFAQAKEENKELEKQKNMVNSEEYIEKVARDECDYAAPDEIIFKDPTSQK